MRHRQATVQGQKCEAHSCGLSDAGGGNDTTATFKHCTHAPSSELRFNIASTDHFPDFGDVELNLARPADWRAFVRHMCQVVTGQLDDGRSDEVGACA